MNKFIIAPVILFAIVVSSFLYETAIAEEDRTEAAKQAIGTQMSTQPKNKLINTAGFSRTPGSGMADRLDRVDSANALVGLSEEGAARFSGQKKNTQTPAIPAASAPEEKVIKIVNKKKYSSPEQQVWEEFTYN